MGQYTLNPATGIEEWVPAYSTQQQYLDPIASGVPGGVYSSIQVADQPGLPSAYNPGATSYDSMNVGADNYVRFGDYYYKALQDGPGITGYDWTKRYSPQQTSSLTSGEYGAIPITINPDYNTDSIWDSPLTGLGVFMGGLGAIGALPGITGAIGDWAGGVLGGTEAAAGSSGLSAAGMGGADLAGWGGITEGAGGLDLLGEGLSSALPGLEGLELGGEGVGQALPSLEGLEIGGSGVGQAASSVGAEFADPSVVDLFNNAGMPGYNNLGQSYESLAEQLFNQAGTPGFTQYGDPATGLDWLRSYLPSNTSSLSSTARTGLSRLLGIPDSVAGGALGLLSWLAARDQRNNQTSQNASNVAALRSPAFNAPLNPTAFAGPQMRNVMGATPSTPRQNVTPTWNQPIRRADGGALSRMSNNTAGPSMSGYAAGGTKGQDDKIPALLSDGEYVLDADIVAALGDGNNAAGAAALDKMRENIRRHKRSAPANKIPPKAKSPEAYMKGAK